MHNIINPAWTFLHSTWSKVGVILSTFTFSLDALESNKNKKQKWDYINKAHLIQKWVWRAINLDYAYFGLVILIKEII